MAMRREEDVQRIKEGTMKGLTLLLLSAAAAIMFAGSATAGSQDHVLGGGKSVTDLINISAHSGPNGESPWVI